MRILAGQRMLLVFVTAALAAVVLVVAVEMKPAEAAFPGANGRIAFSKFAEFAPNKSVQEVFTMKPNGTGVQQLTHASGASQPVFSPDGTKIAYSGGILSADDLGIYVMNRDGSGQKPLTDDRGLAPTWSPDGARIAYVKQIRVRNPDGELEFQVDIWMINADGTGNKNLTNDSSSEQIEETPEWSPDGSKIAFVREGDIWTMNPDGTAQKNLTSSYTVGDVNPSWSPDGTKIAFASNRDFRRRFEIYSMRSDGTAVTNLTNSRFLDEEGPAYSPDGTKITFERERKSDNQTDIFVKNANGTGATTNPTNTPDSEYGPSWGPKPVASQ